MSLRKTARLHAKKSVRALVQDEKQPEPKLLSPKRKTSVTSYILKNLSDDVYTKMLELIRGGCFDHVAARCLGITSATFYRWMRRGMSRRNKLHWNFRNDVLEAQAEARRRCEEKVHKENPEFYLLRSGYCKTQTDEQGNVLPGWQHDGELTINHNGIPAGQPAPGASRTTMGAALQALEELGFIQRTEMGKALFSQENKSDEATESEIIIDSLPSPSTNGNGSVH